MAGSRAIFSIDSTSHESLLDTLLDPASCPPEHAPPTIHLPQTMDKVDIKRYYALIELIDTERAYLRNLKILIHVYLASISPLASTSTPQRSGSSPGSALTRSWSRTHHDTIRIGLKDSSSLLTSHDFVSTTSSATPADGGLRARRSKSLFVHQTTWRSTFGSNAHMNTTTTAPSPPAAATPSLNLFLPAADMNALCRNISLLLSLHERLALSLDHTLEQCGFFQENASPNSAHERQRSALGAHLIDGKMPHLDIDGAVRAVLNVLVEHSRSFLVYASFCSGHESALDVIHRAQRADATAWREWEKACGQAAWQMESYLPGTTGESYYHSRNPIGEDDPFNSARSPIADSVLCEEPVDDEPAASTSDDHGQEHEGSHFQDYSTSETSTTNMSSLARRHSSSSVFSMRMRLGLTRSEPVRPSPRSAQKLYQATHKRQNSLNAEAGEVSKGRFRAHLRTLSHPHVGYAGLGLAPQSKGTESYSPVGMATSARLAPPRLAFMDYLIMPIQRICRYPLLLEQLTTPSKSPSPSPPSSFRRETRSDMSLLLSHALSSYRELANTVNGAMSRAKILAKSKLVAERLLSHPRTPFAREFIFGSNEDWGGWGGDGMGFRKGGGLGLGTYVLAGSLDTVECCGPVAAPLVESKSAGDGEQVWNDTTDGTGGLRRRRPRSAYIPSPHTPTRDHGDGILKARYLGAFLYSGGYMILAKVEKAGVLEARHWFDLKEEGFDVHDIAEDEALLSHSFVLVSQKSGHRFELAAGCPREKAIWMEAVRRACSLPARYSKDLRPRSSLPTSVHLPNGWPVFQNAGTIDDKAPSGSSSQAVGTIKFPRRDESSVTRGLSVRESSSSLTLKSGLQAQARGGRTRTRTPSPAFRRDESTVASLTRCSSLTAMGGSGTLRTATALPPSPITTSSSHSITPSPLHSPARAGMTEEPRQVLIRRPTASRRMQVDSLLQDVFSEPLASVRNAALASGEEVFGLGLEPGRADVLSGMAEVMSVGIGLAAKNSLRFSKRDSVLIVRTRNAGSAPASAMTGTVVDLHQSVVGDSRPETGREARSASAVRETEDVGEIRPRHAFESRRGRTTSGPSSSPSLPPGTISASARSRRPPLSTVFSTSNFGVTKGGIPEGHATNAEVQPQSDDDGNNGTAGEREMEGIALDQLGEEPSAHLPMGVPPSRASSMSTSHGTQTSTSSEMEQDEFGTPASELEEGDITVGVVMASNEAPGILLGDKAVGGSHGANDEVGVVVNIGATDMEHAVGEGDEPIEAKRTWSMRNLFVVSSGHSSSSSSLSERKVLEDDQSRVAHRSSGWKRLLRPAIPTGR